jgi:glycosyltransferase involved in cell wall biosynthesis
VIALAVVALLFATFPLLMFLRNVRAFRRPTVSREATPSAPAISVLIPARNEELGIAACVRSILASTGVTVEVVVLDDSSTDRTADIVRELAAADPRVRLETAPPLPPGWCGKQHACFTLSKLAKYDIITFLDADVRLEPHALANMAGFLRSSGAALVSGFPRQETEGLLEQLVIPLIHWLLVCYLPFDRMRKDLQPGLGAGCGQWFMTTKTPYEKVGGHGHPMVKGSLHDGIKLPRAYRTCGLMTDTCDATADATCRMYRSAGAVWNGFAKNAREGLGGPVTIWIWTVLLAGGHLLPWVLLAVSVTPVADEISREFYYRMPPHMRLPDLIPPPPPTFAARTALGLSLLACWLSLVPRLACAWLYRQSWLGAIFHPVGVLLMLAIQWYAAVRAWVGRPVGWKGRGHPSLPSEHG